MFGGGLRWLFLRLVFTVVRVQEADGTAADALHRASDALCHIMIGGPPRGELNLQPQIMEAKHILRVSLQVLPRIQLTDPSHPRFGGTQVRS